MYALSRVCTFGLDKSRYIMRMFVKILGQPLAMTLNENQTRKRHIDGQLTRAGWDLFDENQVRFEIPASGIVDDWADGITDYSLFRNNGEIIAVVEAGRRRVVTILGRVKPA